MNNLITAYERNRKKNQDRNYEYLETITLGNSVRRIYVKDNIKYVKNNGKYMQLTQYKILKKIKETNCKRDCTKLMPPKICNQKTARCNLIKKK